MLDTQSFRRHERKYLVDRRQLAALHERISGLLEEDVNGAASGSYYNHSIYFDSPRYFHYSEKREGLAIRRKPRLRSYRRTIDGEPDAFFLEFKNRDSDIVWKQRQRIDQTAALGMLEGAFSVHESERPPLLEEFFYCLRRFNLVPAATVLYHRRAFGVKSTPGLRITYDSRIMGAMGAQWRGGPDGFRFSVPPALTMVEIKYDFGFPGWLAAIVRNLQMERVSVSKYALGLEAVFRPGRR
ncbi:MAG: polyphosphate polymerase domain-containing protein [Proteobacteria bacterium]|nr:polyphosphate polymerase domain-containing protein [Pseudomonadota bacterium]